MHLGQMVYNEESTLSFKVKKNAIAESCTTEKRTAALWLLLVKCIVSSLTCYLLYSMHCAKFSLN